jgi:antitoxin (DNA-binding transcriptional repressor) of toxin-antitoxin stability system
MKKVSARQAKREFSELLSRAERGEEIPDHETEQARGVIVPLSPAAADAGTTGGHRACNQGDGTRLTLGRGRTRLYVR